jgi:hypothetical protein
MHELDESAHEGVVSAFVLGWHVAELFHSKVPGSAPRRSAGLDKLAGIGELDPLARARLLLAQVQADLRRIWRLIDGDRHPDPGPVRVLLEADARAPGQVRETMAGFHNELLAALTAADFRLGKAYGLGRALAETALLPDARDPQTFDRQLSSHRLANLLEWLADLKSVFPRHAAEGVRGSLRRWADWSQDPVLRPAPGRSVDWSSAADRESVTRALHRQGQLWRAVLSGEKDGVDLLSGDDYVDAADRLLGHLRQLTFRFLRRFWLATAALVALVAAIVATVIFVQSAARVVVVVLTAGGAIGLTWRSAASGLGRVLGHVQRPLWEGELDTAVADAISGLPRERRPAGRTGA